jgi:chaperonin GroES
MLHDRVDPRLVFSTARPMVAAMTTPATEPVKNVTTIRPLRDRILAKRAVAEGKTSGGLFIPDSAKDKPLEAVVISVGSGIRLENGSIQPLSVKAGDKILIGRYAGSEVKDVGKDHIILREDDVLAILES